jgi:hypothetical protein
MTRRLNQQFPRRVAVQKTPFLTVMSVICGGNHTGTEVSAAGEGI